jgi:hypothetical protein
MLQKLKNIEETGKFLDAYDQPKLSRGLAPLKQIYNKQRDQSNSTESSNKGKIKTTYSL